MITKLSFFISTLVLVVAGTTAAGDGTTKPAAQALAPVAQAPEEDCNCACAPTDDAVTTTTTATATATGDVEEPVNTSYSSEERESTTEDVDMTPARSVDTGTKPAARALQRSY